MLCTLLIHRLALCSYFMVVHAHIVAYGVFGAVSSVDYLAPRKLEYDQKLAPARAKTAHCLLLIQNYLVNYLMNYLVNYLVNYLANYLAKYLANYLVNYLVNYQVRMCSSIICGAVFKIRYGKDVSCCTISPPFLLTILDLS